MSWLPSKRCRMFQENPDRVCYFFVVEFPALVTTLGKLPEVTEGIRQKLGIDLWHPSPAGILLRHIPQKQILVFESHRIYIQGIGIDSWVSRINDLTSTIMNALNSFGVKKISKAGFETWSFVKVGMRHSEMVSLFPGSFLVSQKELSGTFGNLEDVLVQLHGTRGKMKSRFAMGPMKPEHVDLQVAAFKNWEYLTKDPKLFDQTAKDFRDKIIKDDVLFVDGEMTRTDIDCSDIVLFMRESIDESDKMIEECVGRLKAIQLKGK